MKSVITQLFIAALILLVIEAPLGYLVGAYNWTEYQRASVVFGAASTSVHYITFSPLDSLKFSVVFDASAVVAVLPFMPIEIYEHCQGVDNCAHARDWKNTIEPRLSIS